MMKSRCLHFGTIALLLLPLTSAVINESYSDYLFTVPDQPEYSMMTKNDAEQWCENHGSLLLEIYDSRLQQIVEFLANKTSEQASAQVPQQLFGNRFMFTSGVKITETWMWVNGNFTAVGAGIVNQQSTDYAFGYLLLNQTGLFFIADNMPATGRSYICEGGKSLGCGFSRSGRCFASISDTLSWYDARNKCIDDGGDLASFDFVNDQQSLNSLNGTWITINTQYWIGVRRQWWTWQRSGLEIKYTNWQNGHPQPTSGDCLCLLPTSYRYQWTECNCDQQYQFICIKNIGTTTLPTMSSIKTTASDSVSKASPMVGPSSSSSSSSESSPDNYKMRLGVGIGVGVGGLLIIIVVVVVVVLVIRKRRLHKSPGNSRSQRRLQKPDLISEQEASSSYAEIQRSPNDELDANKAANDKTIVYSDLRITD